MDSTDAESERKLIEGQLRKALSDMDFGRDLTVRLQSSGWASRISVEEVSWGIDDVDHPSDRALT